MKVQQSSVRQHLPRFPSFEGACICVCDGLHWRLDLISRVPRSFLTSTSLLEKRVLLLLFDLPTSRFTYIFPSTCSRVSEHLISRSSNINPQSQSYHPSASTPVPNGKEAKQACAFPKLEHDCSSAHLHPGKQSTPAEPTGGCGCSGPDFAAGKSQQGILLYILRYCGTTVQGRSAPPHPLHCRHHIPLRIYHLSGDMRRPVSIPFVLLSR